ncbi:MAG: hypothetical protein A07HR60_01859 [uncultured archaeon A07HR60]|nr:MAG: hypothetical protein A07HR60_01859 [uncultured archaeon A07HR60]
MFTALSSIAEGPAEVCAVSNGLSGGVAPSQIPRSHGLSRQMLRVAIETVDPRDTITSGRRCPESILRSALPVLIHLEAP